MFDTFGTVRQLLVCQSGTLSDERSSLSLVIVLLSLLSIKFNIYSLLCKSSLHVILIPKTKPRYFTLFTNGMFRPFNVRRGSGCLRL
jgi:hypothetical protein